MKNLKTLLVPVGLIALVIGIFSFTNPIGGDEDKKCTIKIVKIENGVETVIDSTFDCDDDMMWISPLHGMEGSLKELLGSIMIEGDSGEHSFNFNMDFDEDEENGVKIMKFKLGDGEEEVEMDFDFKMLEGEEGVMKMMINGEEIEINIGDIHEHIDKIHDDKGVSFHKLGDIDLLIRSDENGDDAHSVKMIKTVKTIDDNGNVTVKKIVDGEEMELDDHQIAEMDKRHKMMVIGDHSKLKSVHGVTIDVSVDTEDGKEMKKVIIISKLITDEKSEKKASEVGPPTKKELSVDELKFSPNPNNGKFDLSFELDKKKPVKIMIIDIQGKEVYNETVSNFDGKYFKNIDISEYGEGVYILGIKQGNKMKSSKMVVK